MTVSPTDRRPVPVPDVLGRDRIAVGESVMLLALYSEMSTH